MQSLTVSVEQDLKKKQHFIDCKSSSKEDLYFLSYDVMKKLWKAEAHEISVNDNNIKKKWELSFA